jgi:ABC-type dipeptide/oligopeptide/nickel transport system permease subunit
MSRSTCSSESWTQESALIEDTVRLNGSLLRYRNLALGASIVAALLVAGILAPLLAPHDPYAQNLGSAFQSPGLKHLFGTDEYGRDMFSRVLYGARLSLLEITVSVGMALSIGVPLGMLSGYLGGFVDHAILWVTDILYAFPGIVLAILIVALLGPGLWDSLIAISVFAIPLYTRLARNLAHSLKHMEYTEAARALGAGPWRILIHHILRNAAVPILVQATLTAGDVVLTASGLSFLGLGAQPPLAEWGAMMADGRNFLGVATYLTLFPGAVITLTALGLNLLGDGLRDRFDPHFEPGSRS